MRLLYNDEENNNFALTKELDAESIPEYATLSHTWLLNNEDEVTFDDLENGNAKDKPGYAKIQFCAEKATSHGLKYFWIDTCCIDKRHSAVLQEALVAMFSWYRNATRCFAYLADVSASEAPQPDEEASLLPWRSAFCSSRWFTRGWTLQELLAPRSVEFFSAEGVALGDRRSLALLIYKSTGIPHLALQGVPL
ncbi:unnamed protein product [Clonostachys rosea f. rosea IK726]|jgi:hypothetical protein|uniref:Heterokaryon incompatibility domain-containing protein n=2 Tax=Bionectria ochroleuca TaxID=29856 RepID=A0A0B7JZ20_BIOOC|nr:unnamed protein product [Clonostachys rosea f. rosea IK726]